MPVDAFTIASNNYLGMACVFADSYLEHHPGATVYTCLVDRLSDSIPYGDMPFEVVPAESIGIPNFSAFSFKYDILELNTAVKPFFFRYLRDKVGLDRAFYFDPDILVHDCLLKLERALEDNLAVLTPHLSQPLDNRCRPPERVIAMCGVYNLGFVGLRLDARTAPFLDWWCDRLDRYCFVDLANGMFVDQSWMDLAPAYLESVAIERDPVFNVAYWNLPHRHPALKNGHWEVDGRRVGFFHFSGVDLEDIHRVSRHQDRIDLASRPELRRLFEHYRDLVSRSGQHLLRKVPYAYARFSGSNVPIPPFARRAFQEIDPCALRWPDPFDIEGEDSFLAWLAAPVEVENGLVNRAATYLWKHHDELRAEFPHIDGGDLARYLEWYAREGAEQYVVPEVFTGSFEGRELLELTSVWERMRREAVTDPGTSSDWLNEPVGPAIDPLITQLAMAVHRARPDVQAFFPDPLGADRTGFAYWFVRYGASDHGLHRSLVDPVERTLPLRSRCALALRRARATEVEPAGQSRPLRPSLLSAPRNNRVIELNDGRILPTDRLVGTNVVGCFEGLRGARSFATDICKTLELGSVPRVAVPVDHDLPELMTTDRIRFDSGAPHQLTFLTLPTREWPSVVRRLPLGCRVGGRLVGYCCEPVAGLRPTDLACVDEVWVPTHAEAHRVVRISPVPVRPVLPPTPARDGDAVGSELRLDPGRTWFLAVDEGRGQDDGLGVSRAVECVRRLCSRGLSGLGLLLLVDSDSEQLAVDLRRLPVEVHRGPVDAEVMLAAVRSCDVVLDLGRHPMLSPVVVEAVLCGARIISGGWREIAEGPGALIRDRFSELGSSDESSEFIEGATAAIADIVAAESTGRSTVASGKKAVDRGPWESEAVDQWRREIFRTLEVVR
jgi:hypothetical protein